MTYPNADSTVLMICVVCSAREGIHADRVFRFLDWQRFPRKIGGARMNALYECPVCKGQQTDTAQSVVIDD